MMVVMTPEATAAQIDAVVAKLEARGVHAKVMPGELTTAIGAIGDPQGVRELGLEGLPGVDQVIPISRPYKLASSELSHHASTSFAVDGRQVGGGETFCLIAGPCTVESAEQTSGVARTVAAAGASMLRGGAFKPRTSPFAFQGLGYDALEILRRVREESGLPVVSELTSVCTPNASPKRSTSCRSAPATCRTTASSRSSASWASRCCSREVSPPRWTSC